MYIRVKKKSDSRYSVQLVESLRNGNVVKQKILRHLGVAHNEQEVEALKEVGELIRAQIEDDRQAKLFSPAQMADLVKLAKSQAEKDGPEIVDLKLMREEARHIVGIHDVYGQVFDELGFGSILPNPARKLLSQRIIKELVLARIACPSSKRESINKLESDFGILLNLDTVYATLDKIDDAVIDNIQARNMSIVKTLFKDKIDILFYDCTTLYFESFDDDDLRKKGYSKDLKFNQPQVVLALLVTKEGLPIGYEVFPGNTYEGHTLIPVLNKFKEQYNLDRVVFVADSGLLNRDNLKFLRDNNFYYIVGARLKSQPKFIQNKILDLSIYQDLPIESGSKLACFPLDQNDQLLVSHSQKRASKDAFDRKIAIEKLIKKLTKVKNPKDYLSNFGYKKYLSIDGETEIKLDSKKITEASRWDGLHGVISNIDWMDACDIINQYKGLWQVEESFRVNKHDLKIRPIYHWKESRVKAHLAICYMAFACVRYLEYRVKTQIQKASPEIIRKELIYVQASILINQQTNEQYILPSKLGILAKKIYKIMNIQYLLSPRKISI
jgi:transposase